MAEATHCTLCGADMPPEAPEGLCPNCLFRVGLESQSQPPAGTAAASRPTGFTPMTPGELNACFPQLEFLDLLGKGGMGAVYKARQKSLDRLVAVKILPPDVGLDTAFADRFTREARALAKLNHPHIVSVHDFGQVELPGTADQGSSARLFYFLMEFVDGINIRQALKAGQLKPPQALQIVPQICDALQYAHEEGVVHRDIKPENILLDKRGRVKIADFGLAKLLGKTPDDLTLTGTKQIVGTVPYMAPEQIEGARDVDHRADIYSLGVTFYEMLTGELPLGRFPAPSKMVQIDVRLDEVVLRTLEKSPDLRYQHAGDVRVDMETISRTPPPKPVRVVLMDAAAQVMHGGKKAADWVAQKMSSAAAEVKRMAESSAQQQEPKHETDASAQPVVAPPTPQPAAPMEAAPIAAAPVAAVPMAAAARPHGFWKSTRFLLCLAALFVVGASFDLTQHDFSVLYTLNALVPVALVAWIWRGTDFGRHAKQLLLWALVAGVALQIVVHAPEAMAILIVPVAIVIAYLAWDKFRLRRPKALMVAASPVPEKSV